jgi:hypothetical protein
MPIIYPEFAGVNAKNVQVFKKFDTDGSPAV